MPRMKDLAGILENTLYGPLPDNIRSTLESEGLTCISGAGDDLMIIQRAVSHECDDSPHVILGSGRIIPAAEVRRGDVVVGQIEPQLCCANNPEGWFYKTSIPYGTFCIPDQDGGMYCIGLVIDHGAIMEHPVCN